MAKLHELLAVDGNLKGQALKTRAELMNTMAKKRHLFEEKLVTFTSNFEGAVAETEAQSSIQTSVYEEVRWLGGHFSKAIDVAYAIDVANTEAKADVILEDDTVLIKGVPATALLQLEKRVKETLEFIKVVPTLDPAKGFEADTTRARGTYKARPVNKVRTQKQEDFVVTVQPTKEHPAQVEKTTKDVKTGTIQELEWSSLIHPVLKAELIDRGEVVLRALTRARSRANEQVIDQATHKIGQVIWNSIFQPLA
jgi:hypothetical protein